MLAALRHPLGAMVADKAYDTNAVLQAIAEHKAQSVIPPKSSRNEPRAYDQNLHADRNKAEHCFGVLAASRKPAASPPATTKPLALSSLLHTCSPHSTGYANCPHTLILS